MKIRYGINRNESENCCLIRNINDELQIRELRMEIISASI